MNYQKPFSLIVLSFFLFVFFVSCTNNKLFEPKENILSQRKIKLKKEILFINIDSLTLHNYQFYQFYKNGEQHLFIGYNNKTHAFDLLDLKSRKILNHIFLNKKGPNAILRVKGFYFHNFDTIFIYNYPYLSILDSKSKVIDKIKIIPDDNTISAKKIEEGFISVNYNCQLRFYPKTNTLYFKYIYPDRKYVDKRNYRGLIAEFNIKSRCIKRVLPAFASKLVSANPEQYNYHAWIDFTCGNNRIYYNFPAESNIYSISLKQNEKSTFSVYGAKSRFTQNQCSSLGSNEDYHFKYYKEKPYFFPLYFPDEENFFVRLHWGEMSLRNSNQQYNLMDEKPLYITIFDQELNYIKELQLDKGIYSISGVFCLDNAFYLFCKLKSKSESNYITLHKYEITWLN